MSWWRRLRPEPPPARGRRHRGAPADPAELADRLSGMLAAYVPSSDQAAGPGTVVLGFADGSSVSLAPGDSRTLPFLTLTDALTVR